MTASDFSDVFVSYRRKNVEFAKQIVQSLNADGREVWIDWEDIPPGSTSFSDDIKRGLEGADAFICILSPDYMQSTYCVDLEMGYAIQLKKKIIPIVLEKFDDYIDKLPDTVKGINWIYFTPHAGHANNYDEAFPKIIQVLDQDLEHAREHKRIALRALEWDSSQRNPSYLLKGKEIREAEIWVENSVDKIPQVTETHLQYITASRRAAIRQQRFLLTSSLVALGVTVILTILALVFFGLARTNEQRALQAEDTAIANEEIALTNEAAAITAEAKAVANFELAEAARATAEANLREAWQSQALFWGDLARQQSDAGLHQQAVLLALESLQHVDEGIVADTSYAVLHEALRQYYRMSLSLAHDDGVLGAMWLDDGSRILSYAFDQTLVIWDADSGEPLHTFTFDFALEDVVLNAGQTLALARTGQFGDPVRLLDIGDGTIIAELDIVNRENYANHARFSADESRVFVTTESGFIIDGELLVFDAATGDLLTRIQQGDDFDELVFNSDETRLITWSEVSGQPLQVWNLETGESEMEIYHSGVLGFYLDALWTADDSQFIINCLDCGENDTDQLQIYDAAAGEQIGTITFDATIQVMRWNADKSLLMVGTGNVLLFYDLSIWKPLFALQGEGVIYDAEWNGDESQVLVREENVVHILDVMSGEQIARFAEAERVESAQWSADESRVLMATANKVSVWDVASSQRCIDITPEISVRAAAWNADESRIMISDGNAVTVYDSQHGAQLPNFASDRTVRGVQWSAGGAQLLTYGEDGSIRLWGVNQAEPLRTMQEAAWVNGVRWNADESQLFSWMADSTLSIWDMAAGERTWQGSAAAEWVTDAFWSADSSQIFIVAQPELYDTGQILHLDVTSGELTTLIDHPLPFSVAMLNSDETQILTYASSDFDFLEFTGEIILWDAATGEAVNELDLEYPVWDAKWSADETRVLANVGLSTEIEQIGYAVIWDIASGDLIRLPHERQINQLAWNSDESQILTVSDDGTAVVWGAEGEAQFTLAHSEWGLEGRWTDDEAFIITWHPDSIKVWDAGDGSERYTLTHPQEEKFTRVSLSPSGGMIAAATGLGSNDILLWNTATGELLLTIDVAQFVENFAWHPVESSFLAWSFSEQSLWLTNYLDLFQRAETLAVRSFTAEEKAQFFILANE